MTAYAKAESGSRKQGDAAGENPYHLCTRRKRCLPDVEIMYIQYQNICFEMHHLLKKKGTPPGKVFPCFGRGLRIEIKREPKYISP